MRSGLEETGDGLLVMGAIVTGGSMPFNSTVPGPFDGNVALVLVSETNFPTTRRARRFLHHGRWSLRAGERRM